MELYCLRCSGYPRQKRGWSLNYSTSQPLAATLALRSYAARARSNELILVEADDEFSSSTLPLPKVRYCFQDPGNVTVRCAPYFVDLGITVNSGVFSDPDRWEPIFRDHLRAWGLDSTETIPTTIVARNDADIVRITSQPDSDFYLPMSLQPVVGADAQSTHMVVPASSDRLFLLANRSTGRVPTRSSMLE